MAKGQDTGNHPSRQVERERFRSVLGVSYAPGELQEAAARGRVNSALDQGGSMPRSQMSLSERLRDPDDE